MGKIRTNAVQKTGDDTTQVQVTDEKSQELHSNIPSPEEQVQLIAKAKKGDLEARNTLLEVNIPFIAMIACQYKYKKLNIDLDELISEGAFGLLKAIEKFDENKQNNFISYAVWWIRYFINKAIQESAFIRKPVNKARELNSVFKLKMEMKNNEKHRDLSAQEHNAYIAKELNFSEDYLDYLMSKKKEIISIESPSINNTNTTASNTEFYGDFIADQNNVSPENHFLEREIAFVVRSCIDQLPEREATIVKMRFGMNDGHKKSLDEVSKFFGISKERVRQIEAKSKKWIRKTCIKLGVTAKAA
ncbi:RNA polymerase sigma factor SigA-like [Ylistrum balloti]|uniref:RNA polymerase sigma factor SigA-like n=1 Tax=Ylistrum balloti TaxID=509963 RepID=UPI00290587F0|nr:RNA polymerase sigma factor SigA-like [Ylistrum balloti]